MREMDAHIVLVLQSQDVLAPLANQGTMHLDRHLNDLQDLVCQTLDLC